MSTKPSSIESLVDSNGAVPVSTSTSLPVNQVSGYTPKFALANVAASQTDSSIVSAVATKKIRVLSWMAITAGTATTITFNSKGAGAGTAISAAWAFGANNGAGAGFSPVGHFETNAGEALTVTTGAGSTTGIQVVYIEV